MNNDSKPTAVPADNADDPIDEILTQSPTDFVAEVISESRGLSLSAKLRHFRSAALDAQAMIVHAKAAGDRYAQKQWSEVSWSFKTMRS